MKHSTFFSLSFLITIVHASLVSFIGKNNFCLSSSTTTTGTVSVNNCSITDPTFISWTVTLPSSATAKGPAAPIVFPPEDFADLPEACLTVNSTSPTNGTIVITTACAKDGGTASASSQSWNVNGDGSISLNGTPFCLDLTNGNAVFGNSIQIWACSKGNTNQIWNTATPPPSLPNAGSSNVVFILPQPGVSTTHCLTAASNADGAPVVIQECSIGSGQNWTLSAGSGTPTNGNGPVGRITTFGGSKCLDLTGGVTTDGNKLQIWTCVTGSTNQEWSVNNVGTVTFAGTGVAANTKCLDNTNGNFTSGNRIQLWDCTNNDSNQFWGLGQDFLNE